MNYKPDYSYSVSSVACFRTVITIMATVKLKARPIKTYRPRRSRCVPAVVMLNVCSAIKSKIGGPEYCVLCVIGNLLNLVLIYLNGTINLLTNNNKNRDQSAKDEERLLKKQFGRNLQSITHTFLAISNVYRMAVKFLEIDFIPIIIIPVGTT